MTEEKDEFHERNEYTERTRILGNKYYTKLQPTFQVFDSQATEKIQDDQTIIVGETQEDTVVDEFWNYYKQFSLKNAPDSSRYYGNEEAELKITILLRLFHRYYLENVYPLSFPSPIIQKSFKNLKNHQQKYCKFFFIGDTHGSFKDVVKLVNFLEIEIKKGIQLGYDVRIVVIGDIVDRGEWDIHNLLYLMTFNLKFKRNVLILRGNHEEISICAHYGFGKRVMDHFSQMLFASFNYMFKDLPLIAIYHCNEGSIMCLHGGIPIKLDKDGMSYEVPNLKNVEFRNRQVLIDEMDEISQQILWNDPILNYNPNTMNPFYLSTRGIGYETGEEIFRDFCIKNQIQLVFRGHQAFRQGYYKDFEDRFITIFSASEYVNKMIDAKVIELNSDDIFNFQIKIIQDL